MSLIRNTVMSSESDGCKLRIDEDEQEGEELAHCVFAFFKGHRFDPHSSVRMCFKGQPAVDTGGVRRRCSHNFLKPLLSQIDFVCSMAHQIGAGRISSLSAGMMKLLGCIIGHSIILDCQGFPYLSPVCYSIMTGSLDKALLLFSPVDASE